ncbi:MAG: DNA cytosine methyltransferase [Thermoproteota archaeon]|jgi:DNA (cytosine-5)-methyltransferase 1|nr:DNA cytosine methyltransferase [Thermoproteota archaeon]
MLKVLDLFCGAGGFSLGFKQANYEIVCGLDNFEPVIRTFSYNFSSSHIILEDIKKVSSKIIKEEVGEVDVIIGGPPCEAFTLASSKIQKDPLDRLYSDPRGQLVLHFIRLVGDLKPIFFVMENVRGILIPQIKEAIIKEFKRVGYDRIYFNVLHAEDYGNPSIRTRVFISNLKILPEKSKIKRTVWDAIGDLPSPYSIHDIPNHDPVPVSERKLRKILRLKKGHSLVSFIGADNRMKENYIRLKFNSLAPTVMGKSRFIHPVENRILTVRENARLMSFPDDFIFFGGREVQFDQVGEAVPPILAKSIALYCLKALKELK